MRFNDVPGDARLALGRGTRLISGLEAPAEMGPGSLAHMAHAVLTTSVGSSYDDLPEIRYHFPKTYFNQVQAAVPDDLGRLLHPERRVLVPDSTE